MKYICCIAALFALVGPAARGQDADAFASSTWVAGTGPRAQVWILTVRGNSITGAVCGPCDDPRSLAPIVDGRVIDAHHITFFIQHDLQGGLFAQYGPYRNEARVTVNGDTAAFESHVEGEAWTSHPVHQNWKLVAKKNGPDTGAGVHVCCGATALSGKPDIKAEDLAGKWIADAGKGPAQVFVFEMRKNGITGVTCGPCDAQHVFLIEGGSILSDTLDFYVAHEDRGEDIAKSGSYTDYFKGTLAGNEIHAEWKREGATTPYGLMTLVGPLRLQALPPRPAPAPVAK